jgi:hypothetical protein
MNNFGQSPVEPNMFDVDSEGYYHLAFLPNETLYCPFKFLSLVPDRHVSEEADSDLARNLRNIKVKVISSTHGHIIIILNVNITYNDFPIHRTFRFYEFENSVAKRRLVLLERDGSSSATVSRHSKQIICVEPALKNKSLKSRVAIEWESEIQSTEFDVQQATQIHIRYKTATAPNCGMFFLLIYRDPWGSLLDEVSEIQRNIY